MNVVVSQSLSHSIVKFLGVAIGMVSLIFVYPLAHDSYGHIQFLFGTASLLIPIIGLGFSQSLIKFFAEYQANSIKKDSFLLLALGINAAVYISVFLLMLILGDFMFDLCEKAGFPLTKVRENVWYILPLAFLINSCVTTMSYISNYGRIAVPSVIYELLYKIFLPILVYLFFLKKLGFDDIGMAMIGFFSLSFAGLLYYSVSIGALRLGFDLGFLRGARVKKFFAYSLFSAASGIGASLAFRVDAVMITEKLNEASTGFYFNILVMAAVIDIPNIAMNKITGPIVSKHWELNEKKSIQSLYVKSSRNALIVGGLIFLGIYFNIDDILSFTAKPEIFAGASTIFLVLGLAKVCDGASGINDKIIIYSNLYKYNLVFLAILGFLNIVMNYVFLDKYGILGAAIATGISLLVFNFVKFLFIKVQYGLNPFDRKTPVILLIGGVTALVVSLLPSSGVVILDMMMKSCMITLLFGGTIYLLKLSPDINDLVSKYLAKIRS